MIINLYSNLTHYLLLLVLCCFIDFNVSEPWVVFDFLHILHGLLTVIIEWLSYPHFMIHIHFIKEVIGEDYDAHYQLSYCIFKTKEPSSWSAYFNFESSSSRPPSLKFYSHHFYPRISWREIHYSSSTWTTPHLSW